MMKQDSFLYHPRHNKNIELWKDVTEELEAKFRASAFNQNII